MGIFTKFLERGRRRTMRRPLSHAPAKPGAPFILGGRSFRSIGESTIEHDYLFIRLVRDLGLDDPHLTGDETPEQFAMRLLTDIIASGRALDALGFLLIPSEAKSEEWTPELGQETAVFLGGLVNPDDKAMVRGLTLGLLSDFFAQGLGSWTLSPPSLELAGELDDPSPVPISTIATEAGGA